MGSWKLALAVTNVDSYLTSRRSLGADSGKCCPQLKSWGYEYEENPCEIDYFVGSWRCRACTRSRQNGRYIYILYIYIYIYIYINCHLIVWWQSSSKQEILKSLHNLYWHNSKRMLEILRLLRVVLDEVKPFLQINFLKLALTQDSVHIKFWESISKKNPVMNQITNAEQCFK